MEPVAVEALPPAQRREDVSVERLIGGVKPIWAQVYPKGHCTLKGIIIIVQATLSTKWVKLTQQMGLYRRANPIIIAQFR